MDWEASGAVAIRSSPTGRETSTSRPATAFSTRIPTISPIPAPLTTSNQNPGLPIDGDYGDSFVKVQLDPTTSASNQNENGWGLKVVDYFTPWNQATLDANDTDLGSGGPTLLPNSVGTPAHPHLLVGGGKQGSVYLIDRGANNSAMTMGEFHNSTDNVVQELANAVGGILSTPAYFNGTGVYHLRLQRTDRRLFDHNGLLSTVQRHDCATITGTSRLAGDLGQRHGERHLVGPGSRFG